ncbi:hypothetical protein BH11PSE11_BH11PSE11_27630 [soil metagenome]
MSSINPEILAKAIKHFADHDPSRDEQTLIALFLQSLITSNATVLSKIIAAKMDWLPFRFIHEQYYKEMELISLLAKSTEWSMNPQVYAKAGALNLKFMQKTKITQYMMGQFMNELDFYEYLALSHGMMSQIRFIPLLPSSKVLDTPFLSTLNEIEVNNGRLIQTQIRFLKDIEIALTLDQREEIVERNAVIMTELFGDVLTMLFDFKAPVPQAQSS